MFVGYERIDADATVKTVAALNIPTDATSAEIQADGGDVLYTMDNATDPSIIPRGMVLPNGAGPFEFMIPDLRRIRFCGRAAAGSALNLHYYKGGNA